MRHLLDIRSLSRKDIETIINRAKEFKQHFLNKKERLKYLEGKRVLTLFFENSTRTRTSFDIAARNLSAEVINIPVSTSSVQKGETLYDTVKTLLAMKVDFIIIRHRYSGSPHFIAKHFDVSVINAGDGYDAHPSQALLDLFSVLERIHSVDGKHILIVGDITHSRVARSNIFLFKKMGAKISVCAPPTLIPKGIEQLGVQVYHNLDSIIDKVDIVNMLRMQFERQERSYVPTIREYRKLFSLTCERVKQFKKDTILTHPGPINRGIELDDCAADADFSLIATQVTNGVAIRMAILYTLAEHKDG